MSKKDLAALEKAVGLSPISTPKAPTVEVPNHCWHLRMVLRGFWPEPQEWQCCHCGAVKTLKYMPMATGERKSQHGTYQGNLGQIIMDGGEGTCTRPTTA
jgi:hypothetical protein